MGHHHHPAATRASATSAASSSAAPPPPPPPPGPPNDNFVNAVVLSGSGSVGGTNIDATGEVGEPQQPDQGQINSVWYRFTPTASGSAHFDTCTDVLYDGYMASYTGPAVDQLTNIGFNDDGCGGFGTGACSISM